MKKVQENVQNAQKQQEEKRLEEISKPLWKSEKYNGIQSKLAEQIKVQRPFDVFNKFILKYLLLFYRQIMQRKIQTLLYL